MSAFRFSLQKVLEWRRTQMEVEEARLRQHAALAELEQLRSNLEAAAFDAESSVREQNEVAGFDLAALEAFHRHVERRRRHLDAQRAARERQIAEQKETLLEARRRYRLLENLRDRRLYEWRAAVDREVENFAGEAYLAGFTRRARR